MVWKVAAILKMAAILEFPWMGLYQTLISRSLAVFLLTLVPLSPYERCLEIVIHIVSKLHKIAAILKMVAILEFARNSFYKI